MRRRHNSNLLTSKLLTERRVKRKGRRPGQPTPPASPCYFPLFIRHDVCFSIIPYLSMMHQCHLSPVLHPLLVQPVAPPAHQSLPLTVLHNQISYKLPPNPRSTSSCS
uniref:Uncharacterized protein n=1 Tax=Zea mays TaxID=4577 RepID=A0A804LPH3_MAIZE